MSKGGGKRSRVLAASQNAGATKLTPQQIQDAQRRVAPRMAGVDVLAHEQSRIQTRIQELKSDLPHLHGFPFYQWAREFFESRNKINLLCAANQASKSSTAIRKNIEWACNKKLWPELWKTEPRIFWYFYPSEAVASVEFEKKWVPEFLPRGAMKNHPQYGWDVEYTHGLIEGLHFKSGVTIYFKSYGQKVINLQTATVHMVTCFTAGHLVVTSTGLKKIEDVRVGDKVATHSGWKIVINRLAKDAEVIRREFTNGEVLEGTPDHPILTCNRGWVGLSDLTLSDDVVSLPAWNLIKKLYCLRECFTRAARSIKTLGLGITLPPTASNCMSKFGSRTTNAKSPTVTLYTPKTSTLWTIGLRIWSFLQGRSIQEYTRKKIGSTQGLGNSNAQYAQEPLQPEAPKSQYLDIAPLPAAMSPTSPGIRKHVSHVVRSLLVGKLRLRDSALPSAPTTIKTVYNITVEGEPSYLCNGIYSHNCDEEADPEIIDELMARLRATGGYFNQIFTATRGLQLWYRAMECIGTEDEAFKTAYKRSVSLYECQTYEDGSPSPWTLERIAEAEAQCTSKREVLKRIHGRFVKDEGLRYESFDPDRNVTEFENVPPTWKWYGAVDIGSGGKGRSAGAIVLLAVNPEFTRGRIVRTWRGDNEETTAADILRKYRELKTGLAITQASYDYASREFGLIAARSGEPFIRADKTTGSGEATLNTLFKTAALTIDSGNYHNTKLVTELMSVPAGVKNRNFQDDLVDAARYVTSLIPWDFPNIAPGSELGQETLQEYRDDVPDLTWTNEQYLDWECRQRRGDFDRDKTKEGWAEFDEECEEWNEAYGN